MESGEKKDNNYERCSQRTIVFNERKTKKQRTRTETDLEGQRKKQRRADQYRRIKGRNIRDTKEESAEEVTKEILQHRTRVDHQRPIKNRHRKDTITYYYVLLMYKEALNKGDK